MREFIKKRGIPAVIVISEALVVVTLLIVVLIRANTSDEPVSTGVQGVMRSNSDIILAGDDIEPEIDPEFDENELIIVDTSDEDEEESEEIDLDLFGLVPMGAPDTEPAEREVPEEILAAVASMTVEDKVAQLFFVAPETFTGNAVVSAAGNMTRSAVQKYPVSGFVYSAANYFFDSQFNELVTGAKSLVADRIDVEPLIMYNGTDPEGKNFLTLSIGENDEAVTEVLSGRSANEVYDTDLLYSFYEELFIYDDCEPVNVMYDCTADNAIPALLSGADALFVSDDFRNIYDTVFNAVSSGELPIETVDNAIVKILSFKKSIREVNGNI